jgi:hypothetical protein
MATMQPGKPSSIAQTLDRIIGMSIEDYYNPYKTFRWPETLPDEQWWMTHELMTVHGTEIERQLSTTQLMALSKWESIHFYSLNVHGIRELLIEVVKRIHSPGFEMESEFFHHFVGEENEHMWFFATFCQKYGGKIYPDKKIKLEIEALDSEVESLLVFARILIFEEIVDYFNLRVGRDESLHPIIRQVNSIHHQDESRHIAFGREIVKELFENVRLKQPGSLAQIDTYLSRYLVASIQSLYSPAVYRDAGLAEPYQARRALLADPARRRHDTQVLKRTVDFFAANHIIGCRDLLQ